MKTKILILNVEQYLHERMLARELKELAEKYEVLLAYSITDALHQIAKAKILENDPICGLVFERNTLVSNGNICRVVYQFAEHYSNVIAINMIGGDGDIDAKKHSVGENYCVQPDWQQVKNIFDNQIKE